jgi:hypothetical protein
LGAERWGKGGGEGEEKHEMAHEGILQAVAMLDPYPHPISGNKLIVFTRIEHERRCKSVILLEFFADSSQQRS